MFAMLLVIYNVLMKVSNHALSFANELDKEMGLKSFKVNGVEMKRTDLQNNSHWKYCELMAEGLNNTQASVQKVCTLPISFTKDNFHELIWLPVQIAMFPDIDSTRKLDTKQMSEVYEQVDKIINDRWSVHAEWPSVESLYNESQQRFNTPIKG